jgi:21S rRNA (GM2251-2'-O)-methyltransferase
MLKRQLSVVLRKNGVRFQSSSSSSISNQPRAPFASHRNNESSGKAVNFDRNMPSYVPKKAWEKDGQDKESWFKRKHAHHHVLQKPAREDTERRYQGIERKKREERMERVYEREAFYEHRSKLKKLRNNPQIDYLFGTNSVLAALKGNKRKRFGKLYIHNPKDTDKANEILELAKEMRIAVKESTKQDLNQLTDNAVHNGIVLETRPMEVLDIRSMLPQTTENSFNVKTISNFDLEEVGEFSTDSYGKRYPFGLYLDEISDPHNVGAILRSAYFLGVDFVIFSERNCAPLSPVVAKTSAGAMELLDLFKVDKPLNFFDESKANGWKFISTVSPNDKKINKKNIDIESITEMLKQSPIILVVGSEGTGIRTNLINKSDHLITVNNGRAMDDCVDSLNVSVATALLISKILT